MSIDSIGRREKTDPDLYNFKYYMPSKIDLRQPTVLCFAGNGANDIKNANGFASMAQRLLGRQECFTDDVQILSAVYSVNVKESSGHIFNHNCFYQDSKQERNFSNRLERTFSALFSPLIQHDNTPLPAEQVKENFRNLTIFSHSYGGVITAELGNWLQTTLQNSGYAATEIDDICSQIVHISMGNVAPVGSNSSTFRNYRFFNQHDAQTRFAQFQIQKSLSSEEKLSLQSNAQPVYTYLNNEHVFCFGDLQFEDLSMLTNNGHYGGFLEDAEQHDPRYYGALGIGKNHLLLPLMISAGLRNSLNNSIHNAARTADTSFIPLSTDKALLFAQDTEKAYRTVISDTDIAQELRKDSPDFLPKTGVAFTGASFVAETINYEQRLAAIMREQQQR